MNEVKEASGTKSTLVCPQERSEKEVRVFHRTGRLNMLASRENLIVAMQTEQRRVHEMKFYVSSFVVARATKKNLEDKPSRTVQALFVSHTLHGRIT